MNSNKNAKFRNTRMANLKESKNEIIIDFPILKKFNDSKQKSIHYSKLNLSYLYSSTNKPSKMLELD